MPLLFGWDCADEGAADRGNRVSWSMTKKADIAIGFKNYDELAHKFILVFVPSFFSI